MTERSEMLALDDQLDGCVTRSGGIDLRDPKLLRDAAAAIRKCSAQAEPVSDAEYPFDNEKFNDGVQHVVDLISRELGVTDWVSGNGSEDYDCDLWQTILNILTAKGLYDKDEGVFAALPAPAGKEVTGWQPIETASHNTRIILAWRDWRDDTWCMEVGPATTGQRFDNGYSTLSRHGSATHWMPLPAAPTITAKGSAKAMSEAKHTADDDLVEFARAVGECFAFNPARDRYGRPLDGQNVNRLVKLAIKYKARPCYNNAEQAGEVARNILTALAKSEPRS